MIDPKELRIGNYIRGLAVSIPKLGINSDGTWQVTGFGIHRLEEQENRGENINYEPIPIIEEWLIKFGFELKRIDEDDTFERYQLPIPKTSWYLANVITYGSVTLFNNRDHTSTGVGAQYVHQLQNLFHSLTGEELTIKE